MMIDNLKVNENIHPNSREIELLRADFPQFFDKDGEFCIDRFKKMLRSSGITLSKEGYELNFLGKSYARYLSSTKTETFISPDIAENAKEENKSSENLYIIGDNLDALKHLLGSYAGKIKCIYIDPPYNTGSDGFVYPDNFTFNAKELADTIGIEEEEAERIIKLKGRSSHSAWLTFMYPRLILARELLSDDGVIFISIDDNEQANLKMACDEVFGEENFIATLTRKALHTVRNSSIDFNKNTDFVLSYLRNRLIYESDRDKLLRWKVDKSENYRFDDNDGKGPYKLDPIYARNYATPYDFKFKNGIVWEAPEGSFPRYSKDTLTEMEKNNELYFSDKSVSAKRYLNRVQEGQPPDALLRTSEVGYNSDGTKELAKLLENDKVFSQPKPSKLVKFLIALLADNTNMIILDFFSGSATTAHAVMQLNAEDGGNRKYILVQLPEQIKEDKPAYKAGYRTIDEIGRERIRRAAKKIKEETNAGIDYGFKTFYLNELKEDVLTNLLSFDDNPKLVLDDTVGIFDTEKAKGKEAILTTYLVLDGYGLSAKAEEYKLSTYIADRIEGSLYIIEQGLESEDVMELIRRIENLELDIARVVIYTSSISFNVLHELKKNLANLRNNKSVELIERY